MKSFLKRLRWQGPRVLGAFVAVAFAVSVPASGKAVPYASDMLLRVINKSDTTVTMSFCTGVKTSMAYRVGRVADPCSYVTETSVLTKHGGVWKSSGGVNPVGAIMKVAQPIYFFVSNPPIGKPFFDVNGQHFTLAPGGVKYATLVSGSNFKFSRDADSDGKKIMTLEIDYVE